MANRNNIGKNGQQIAASLKVFPTFTELDELMQFRTKPDFETLANERLIATLTRNLADMQQPARRDAVSVCRG